jgi:ABC-type branched-subunit amino acid transport system substrate-binding protein
MSRARGWKALAAIVCALALTATAAACSSSSSEGGSSSGSGSNGDTTGISGDTIKIGIAVSDLDGLRAAGFSLAPALTTQNLSKRVTTYFDEWNAAGGINGYKVEPVVMTWDPVKPATAQKVCDDATINTPVFAFVNSSGMGAKYIECIAAAGVPTFYGEVAPQSAHDTGVLTTISASAEVNATAGIDAAIADGQIAKGASVGIITGNGPEHVAATTAAKAALEANNNKVTVVAVNTLGGDTGVMSTESAAAVNTFKAAGVANVVNAVQFTSATGFWDGAAGNNWSFTFLDVASSACTAFGAKSLKPSAVGGICYTTFGDNVNSSGSLATETTFEKECRAHFDAMSTADFGGAPSYPGVPSGETRTLPDGTNVSSDYAPVDCTFSNVIKLALTKAGKDLDRGSFMKAVRSLGDVPIALASNGKGNAAEGKTYLATLLHGVKLTAAPTGTAKNATGTYNGCAIDVQCWVPTNSTWYPITK